MKTTLLTALLLCPFLVVLAQKQPLNPPPMPRSEENNQVYYMEVVAQEAPAAELFRRAVLWYRKFYKNPTGVLELYDSVEHKLVLKPQFTVFREKKGVQIQAGIVKYTLSVACREGRYRYEIKDINLKSASYFPIERLFNPDDPDLEDNYHILSEAHQYFTNLIADLKAAMKEPSVKVKRDDW
ncbi:MAG: DUF4468 domain-containing protein [Chitinophagales bacterium]|nr:DUF4468 domain-containing protein [Chitinophagales bacterium]MDW8428369.1 DUF4468 domain-containing protein [Chitinophagales bacterium]